MVKRSVFQLRCESSELVAWRQAAGDVPLSRWLRRVANEAAARPVFKHFDTADGRVEDGAVLPPDDDHAEPMRSRVVSRSFSPDFKKGGK